MTASTFPFLRFAGRPPQSVSPRAKSHNYLNLIMGDLEVKAQDPEGWALLLDSRGFLAEGIGSNIFTVKGGVIYTPRPQYVLGGISRETTIELAEELEIDVVENGHRPVRRVHRGRGVPDLDQSLHLRRSHRAGQYDRRRLDSRADHKGAAGRVHRPCQLRLGKPVHDQAGRLGRRTIQPVLRHPVVMFDGRP